MTTSASIRPLFNYGGSKVAAAAVACGKVSQKAASCPLRDCLSSGRRLARKRGLDDLSPRNGVSGNAARAVVARDSCSIPAGISRAAFFRPSSPLDWSPEERELLVAMPLRSRDLVAYQLASVSVTTILKAGLVTLLLAPDLRLRTNGSVGLLLVMLMLEMLRMAIEIATWGMGRASYLAYRVAVVAGLMAGGFAVGAGDRARIRSRWSNQFQRRTPRTPFGHPRTIERFRIPICCSTVSAVH